MWRKNYNDIVKINSILKQRISLQDKVIVGLSGIIVAMIVAYASQGLRCF